MRQEWLLGLLWGLELLQWVEEKLYLTVSASEPGALQMIARNWEEVKQEGTPSYQPQSN